MGPSQAVRRRSHVGFAIFPIMSLRGLTYCLQVAYRSLTGRIQVAYRHPPACFLYRIWTRMRRLADGSACSLVQAVQDGPATVCAEDTVCCCFGVLATILQTAIEQSSPTGHGHGRTQTAVTTSRPTLTSCDWLPTLSVFFRERAGA